MCGNKLTLWQRLIYQRSRFVARTLIFKQAHTLDYELIKIINKIMKHILKYYKKYGFEIKL